MPMIPATHGRSDGYSRLLPFTMMAIADIRASRVRYYAGPFAIHTILKRSASRVLQYETTRYCGWTHDIAN